MLSTFYAIFDASRIPANLSLTPILVASMGYLRPDGTHLAPSAAPWSISPKGKGFWKRKDKLARPSAPPRGRTDLCMQERALRASV